MAYLGVPPQSGFISNAKERYTGITTAYVDLNHSISSLADVIVWVNYVKQDATNLTLTSSTRITLGATLVSADIVEVAYLGKAVSTQAPATGQVTNDMLAGSIANSKLANSSITLNGSAVSLGGSATVDNTPMWRATSNANQTISASTWTKLNYVTEVIDTDSAFSSSRFTVPSGANGRYMIGANVIWLNASWSNQQILAIYKNGSQFHAMYDMKELTDMGTQVFTILDLVATDYIEIWVYQPDGSRTTWSAPYQFWGYKLIS